MTEYMIIILIIILIIWVLKLRMLMLMRMIFESEIIDALVGPMKLRGKGAHKWTQIWTAVT